MTGWWWAVVAAVVLMVAVTALAVGFVIATRAQRAVTGPSQAQLLAEQAVAAAPAAHLVVAADGSILLANPLAHDFGIVTADGTLDARLADRLIDCAARPAVYGADSWEMPGLRGRAEVLSVSVRPLGDGLVLATATDETASRTAELIRRDFVANVSHELKSPVTAIGLLAEAVTEAADSPETVTGFAQQMQREAARLGTLITDIIALSAIQGGGLHEVHPVRIDDIVAEAADRAAVAASAAGIAIRVGADSGATVMGDHALLVTAVGNLVSNAVHYSESQSEVTVAQVVRRGFVDIAVADHGIGIAPPDQRRVFERFFRADPARSRATGGTGLGLAIVKHVAANHRGSVRLASRLGAGSTFTLRLPLAGTVPDPVLVGEIEAVANQVDDAAALAADATVEEEAR